jgi:hypothetical protein
MQNFKFDFPVNHGKVLYGMLTVSGHISNGIKIDNVKYTDVCREHISTQRGIPYSPSDITPLIQILCPDLEEKLLDAAKNHAHSLQCTNS